MSKQSVKSNGTASEYVFDASIVNELYEDVETECLKRVVHCDEFIVVLRFQASDTDSGVAHEVLSGDEFGTRESYGRLNHKEDASSDIPAVRRDDSEFESEFSGEMEGVLIDGEQQETENVNEDIVIEYENGEGELSDSTEGSNSTEGGADEQRVAWREVPSVGVRLEESLYSNGFERVGDVLSVDESVLLEIPQIGEGTASDLKAFAVEHSECVEWRDVPGVGEEVESMLHQCGYRSVSDVDNVSEGELRDVERVGCEKASDLKLYASDQSRGDVSDVEDSNAGGDSDSDSGSDSDSDGVSGESGESESSLVIRKEKTSPVVDWSEVKFVGEYVMGELREHGFETASDVCTADDSELSAVNQLGDAALKNVKSHANSRQLTELTS